MRELAPDPDALDPIAAAQAHGLAAAAARHRGDLAGDLDGYRRVLAAAERAGDLRTAVNARVSVAFGYMQLGRFATAEEELVRALADAEAMELDGIATRARQNLALVRMHRGDLSTAASLADRVIAESSAQGNVRFTGWTLIYRAQVALAAGDAGGALAFAREAAALLEPSPPARAGALAVGARALTALGRPSEALGEVSEAMGTLSALGGIEEFESLVRLAHVEALEASGERAARDAAPGRGAREAGGARERHRRRARARELPERRTGERAHARPRGGLAPKGRVMGDGKTAFDAARFRAEAAQVIERLAAHLEAATSGATRPSPGLSTFEAEARFPDAFGEDPIASVEDVLERFLTNSNHQHHPGYVGHQVTSPLPRAALFDLVGSLLNNGMAAFESGPAAVAMERAAVRFLCAHAGFPLGDGVLTSGGSLGNLTALLVARQARAGFDGWESGLCVGPPLAVLASADAHYSVSRAAGVLGLGAHAVIGVPVDAERRIRADALPEALSRATSEGRRVIAVVANAGSTVTGAIDPLEAIASFARSAACGCTSTERTAPRCSSPIACASGCEDRAR
ncbi:MAG: pyridoxal-dependent decarboxylase [Sandaracinaceae bacterium]|nr:pyridoxal-dependent decarboxylase [Sandaracinaceae bacterium]